MKTLLEKYRPLFEGEGAGSGGGDGGAGASAGAADTTPAAAVTTALGGGEPAGDKQPNAADIIYGEDGKPKETPAADDKKGGEEGKTDDDKSKDKKEEGEDKKKDGEEEKPALKAEDIDLTPPEGFELDEAVATEFKEFAVANNLTLDQVNALKNMQAKVYEKQTAAYAETVAKWGEDLKKDKEIGGPEYDANVAAARTAIREFFSPEAKTILETSGLGNHPELVRGFVRLGKAMGEGTTITGGHNSRTTVVDAMYGGE